MYFRSFVRISRSSTSLGYGLPNDACHLYLTVQRLFKYWFWLEIHKFKLISGSLGGIAIPKYNLIKCWPLPITFQARDRFILCIGRKNRLCYTFGIRQAEKQGTEKESRCVSSNCHGASSATTYLHQIWHRGLHPILYQSHNDMLIDEGS